MSMTEQIRNAKGAIITSSGTTRFLVNLIFIEDGKINIRPLQPEFNELLLDDMAKYRGDDREVPRHYFKMTGEGYNKYNSIRQQLKKYNPDLNFWSAGKLRLNNIS
jgi:hypothetical protein